MGKGCFRRRIETISIMLMCNRTKNNINIWVWIAFLCAIVPMFALSPGIVVGDTVTSRMATVYALAHDGVWHIDRPPEQPPNPFEAHTVDKVSIPGGHVISSKPPVLPLLMTLEYVAVRAVFGWNLDHAEELRPILQCIIVTLVKIPYFVGLFFFALTLGLFLPGNPRAALPFCALAFASPLPGYACQINNHTPAAAAVMIVFYFGLGLYSGKLQPTPFRFFGFGLFSATVFVMDMPATIFPAVMGLLLFFKFPRQSGRWSVLGAAPVLLLHFSLMTFITGSPFPVQTRESMYNFRNSYWRNPIGVDGLNEPWFIYLFHMTFGRFGTFLLFPVLLTGAGGLCIGLRDKACPVRMPMAAATAAFIIMTTYYTISTNNYGGAAYGFRWHIAAIPVLLLLSLPLWKHLNKKWHWAMLALFFAVSLFSAWECMAAPWGASHEWTCRWIFGPVY